MSGWFAGCALGLALGLALGPIVGCAAAAPTPHATDVDRLRSRWPEIQLADLDEGLQLYRNRCSACHQLYSPHRYLPDEWPAEVEEMRERAELTSEQEQRIIRYLVAISTRSANRKDPKP